MQPAVTAPVERSIRNWICLLAADPVPANDATNAAATSMTLTSPNALRDFHVFIIDTPPPGFSDPTRDQPETPRRRRPPCQEMRADRPSRSGTIATHRAPAPPHRTRTPAVPSTSQAILTPPRTAVKDRPVRAPGPSP